MQRDLTVIRRVLLDIEQAPEHPVAKYPPPDVHDDGLNDAYLIHAEWAAQAGLIDIEDVEEIKNPDGSFKRKVFAGVSLSWQGTEALELLRDEQRVIGHIERIRQRWGGCTFEALIDHLSGRASF